MYYLIVEYLTLIIAIIAGFQVSVVIFELRKSISLITTKQVVRFVVALIVLIATFYYKFFIADF